MTRDEFLFRLREGLNPLSQEERDAAVHYYEEFLDEAGDEQAAIESLGGVETIVQRILQENGVQPPQPVQVVEKIRPTPFYKSVWFWLCAILTLPVWLPVGLALLGVALGIAAAALAAAVALAAALVAVALTIVALILGMIFGGAYGAALSFYLIPGYWDCFLALLGISLAVMGAGLLLGQGFACLLLAGSTARRNRAKVKEEEQ